MGLADRYEHKVQRMKTIMEQATKSQQDQECDVIHQFLVGTHVETEGLKTTEQLLQEYRRLEKARPPSEQMANKSILGKLLSEKNQKAKDGAG